MSVSNNTSPGSKAYQPQSSYNNSLTPQPHVVSNRGTPQPQQFDDMNVEDATQLAREHKELREKYIKVKKYYFEKEDQVKQLQNSLANQRLAASRTSLDDAEYSTRFNRLDGLTAQLAFSVRKNWKTIPLWLARSVNKDAITTGKQEMTAAGRAFISCWLVEEVFEKYFHPDLDIELSLQLKTIQNNIRRLAPPPQSTQEDEAISARITNWRLTTLDGLRDRLQPAQDNNRTHLIEMLKENLMSAIVVHLQDPPMSDLEGGIHMIIELAVSIATHLPLESRQVQIDYFMPDELFRNDIMKIETGIPALGVTVAEDASDRVKKGYTPLLKSTSMSNGISGVRLDGSDENGQRVRMAIGIGAHVRFKTTLIKAPIFCK